MDVNAIMQLVGALGAPVVLAGALLWKSWKDGEAHEREIQNLTKASTENLTAITAEIHNNNVEVIQKLGDVAVALTQLADKLDK